MVHLWRCAIKGLYTSTWIRWFIKRRSKEIFITIWRRNEETKIKIFLDNGLSKEQQEEMDDIYESLMFEVKKINLKFYNDLRSKELTEKDVLKLIHSKKENIVQNELGQFELFGEWNEKKKRLKSKLLRVKKII